MNASLWQLAGWTMIHSLWLGAAVALAGGFLRLACRHAAPNTRYAISLATLAALAATPLATAAWLSVNGVPQVAAANTSKSILPPPLGGEGWGGGQPGYSASPPSLTLPSGGREPDEQQADYSHAAVIDLAHTSPSPRYSGERLGEGLNPPSATPQPSATVDNPSPNPSVPGRGIASLPSTNHQPLATLLSLLPTLWLIGAPLTFTLLATGLLGSARLRRRAKPLTAGPAFDACERLRQTLNITRRVALAVSDGVAQPILVGAIRPLILLPTAALAGWTPEQLDMVLLHELAHVRRWDNLVNLLQRIIESLLFFHPAVWLLSRQVRRDREECCDAAVIRHTDRPHQYAELLVSIAAALRGGPAPSLAVASAMASHPLAGRIRRILNLEEEPMRITRRTLAATLLLPLLLAGAIFYSGANAEDGSDPPPSKGAEQPSTVASGERAQGGSPREAIRGGIAEASDPSTVNNDDKEEDVDDAREDTLEISTKPQPATIKAAEGIVLKVYPIANLPSDIDLRQWMELISSDPRIEIQWMPKEKGLLIAAPERIHDELESMMKAVHKGTTSGDLSNDIKIPQLKNEIRSIESLIAKTQSQLVDLEVFKELAAQNGPGNPTLEAAVAQELDRDPTINQYKQQLLELQTHQSKQAESKNPNLLEIKRLRASMQEAEAELAKYRSEAEQAVRDKLAKAPNETLRAAMVEYKIRRKSIDVNLARYKQDLEAAKTKLAQLTAAGNPPPQPAPLLDRLEQLRLAFDQQRPLFVKQPGEQLQKVHYDGANLPDIVGDHWPYLIKGISNEPGKPPISFNWTGLGNKNYELEVPVAAHEKLFRPMFDGQLPTVAVGNPNSQNQDSAATRSNPNMAPPTAQVSPNDAAPVQEPVPPAYPTPALNKNAQSNSNEIEVHFPPGFPDSDQERERIRKSLEAEGFKAFHKASQYGDRLTRYLRVNVPNGLPAKPVWESRPEGMVVRIINEPARSPGSQNQGGEATGSEPDMARTSNQASSNSAAPVQESESPTISEFLKAFAVRADNPQMTREIDVSPNMREGVDFILQAVANHPDARNVELEWKWLDDGKRLELKAAEQGHAILNQPLPHSLIQSLRPRPTPFPTLENQKIADRAYKLLGLELEPLTPLELERVKKLGYAGGLRVVAVDSDKNNGLPPRTLLVGLHVWPITDLQSLDAVLTREDLDDLSPLRFRAVDTTSDLLVKHPKDQIFSGRLPIDLEAFRSMQRTLPPNAAKSLPSNVSPASDAVSVMQPPTTQKTSIFGGTVTTAYLKVKFTRPTDAIDDSTLRVSPQEIERSVMNCLALIKSPNVLKAALDVITPREAADMKPEEALLWLMDRLSATFPGDGEILELKLEGGDAKEDQALLQAIIDAFIAAMNMPPESPADPNAVSDSAADAPGDLSRYVAGGANPALTAESSDAANTHARGQTSVAALEAGDAVALTVAGAFPEAPLDDVFVIEPEGTLALGPLYGRVAVAGKTVLEAEAAVKEHLSKTLTDFAVQLTLAPGETPAAATSAVGASSSPTFLYDGKTFDQWRDLWKLELNPERRTEAINALAAFSRAGNGDEAINAILDVAAEYDFTRIADGSEGKLQQRILEQFTNRAGVATPQDPWIPLLLNRLEQDPEKWRGLAIMLFNRATPPERSKWGEGPVMSADNAEHLRKFAADPQHATSPYVLAALYRVASADPAVDALIKEAFASPNAAVALGALQGVAFTRLDEFPEQFEMLFAEDEKTRKEARLVLVQNYAENRHQELLTRLIGILDDPGQSARHADAIRALGVIGRVRDGMRPSLETETRKLISNRLIQLRKDGPKELFVPSSVALSSMYSAYSQNESKELMKLLPAERKKLMDESAEQLKQEEASLF